MYPITQRLSAAGYSPWVMINRVQSSFKVGLAVVLSSGAALTYSVEYSMDNPNDPVNLRQDFVLTRTTTSLNVKWIAHGRSVGDWVKLWGNGGGQLDGEYQIATVVDVDNFTVTVANSGPTAGNGTGWIQSMRVYTHAAMVSLAASSSGDFSSPVIATRLHVITYTSGTADFEVIQGRG
jgi:hypothetical protein